MKGLVLGGLLAVLSMAWACSSPSKPGAPMASEGTASKGSSGDYYREESAKGRLYVFGTEKAHQSFSSSGHTPGVAVSFIGSGPSGETVVLEADAKAPELQNRLKDEYNRRHNSALQ